MHRLLALALCVACAPEEEAAPVETGPYSERAFVLDFGEDVDNWMSVDDTVMGGVSDSELTYTDSSFIFEGVVSTDSNGGFTSVRSATQNLDLSMYSKVLVRMRNEGQPFSMVIADAPFFFQPQYKADLVAPDDGWHTLEVPLDSFEQNEFIGGYPTPNGVMLSDEALANVDHMELISKLFEDGPFRLEVDWIAFD